jgi:hypothetical protein
MRQNDNKKYSRKHDRRRFPWMPILLSVGGLLLVIGAIFAFIRSLPSKSAIEVTGSPSLKVDKEEVNLGDVKIGKNVLVSFRLTNVGDKPLVFNEVPYIEVKVGCCPPTPSIGSMSLQPGESTTLTMEFTMMAHGGMDGPHDFRVHLPSNDPDQPDRTLAVLSNWVR